MLHSRTVIAVSADAWRGPVVVPRHESSRQRRPTWVVPAASSGAWAGGSHCSSGRAALCSA
jgi:hypothetical protein